MSALRLHPLRVALVASAMLAFPTAAWASAIPDATYTGTASDGATVTLTVSSDGTSVTSYQVLGIFGTDSNNNQCQGTAEEAPGAWAGASITNDSFQASGLTFSIGGDFSGSQSVSGTFDLDQAAVGGSPGCSSGNVTWTASTSSTATSGGGGSTSGGGGSTGTGSSSVAKKKFSVRLSLRRQAQKQLIGSLKASTAACTSKRMVSIWTGRRRLFLGRASANGKFTFRLRKAWREKRVHATVPALSTKSGTCKASKSTTIRG